jgi:hypothetical protein
MKKIILTLIPALCVALAAAQPPQGERPQRSKEEIQTLMEQRIRERDAELRKTLSLNDAEAHKVDSINAKYDRLLQELTPDGDSRREARPNDRQMRPGGPPPGGRPEGGRPGGRPEGRPDNRRMRPDDEHSKKLQNLEASRQIEVREYLTEEQQAKYDKWLKESQQRRVKN